MKLNEFEKLNINDCFLLKIKSDMYSQYNGMYLLLYVIDKMIDDNNHKNIYMRIKLIKNNDNVNKINLENSEYVKTKITWIEERYFPFNGQVKGKEHILTINEIPIYPNEYGMLFEYEYNIIVNKRKNEFINNLEYIGNYKLTPPKKGFIPPSYGHTPFEFASDLTIEKFSNTLLKAYEENNLEKSIYFNYDEAFKKHNFWWNTLKMTAQADEVIEKMKKEYPNLKASKKDTLTYVGPEKDRWKYE